MHPPPPSPNRERTVARVIDAGAVAVVRLDNSRDISAVCQALHDGGVHVVELTMTTPGALDAMRAVSATFRNSLVIGAGSVLNAADATHAIEAGAQFLVSPVFSSEVLQIAHEHDVPTMPGAFTPTEMLFAHEAGADVVKIFPADTLGPAFIRAVRGPMPFLRLMPTGGVTPDNVGDWLGAGAVAVGLGGALVDPKLVAAGNFAAIQERAHAVTAGVAAFRARTNAARVSAADVGTHTERGVR